MVNSRSYTCWQVPGEGYNNAANSAQRVEKNSVPKQTNPHGDPVHWNTKDSKQNLAEELPFFGWKKSTNDRHKVTSLQVGFPGSGTGTNHWMEIMETEGCWDHWGQRE